jgi:hypothetical protein
LTISTKSREWAFYRWEAHSLEAPDKFYFSEIIFLIKLGGEGTRDGALEFRVGVSFLEKQTPGRTYLF